MADAFNLPVRDSSVGAVFASCFGGDNCKDLALKLKDKKFKPSAWKTGIPIGEIELVKPAKKSAYIRKRHRMRKMAILEVCRALRPGGLLVWQAGDNHDVRFAVQNGFEMLFISVNHFCNGYTYDLVFRKAK